MDHYSKVQEVARLVSEDRLPDDELDRLLRVYSQDTTWEVHATASVTATVARDVNGALHVVRVVVNDENGVQFDERANDELPPEIVEFADKTDWPAWEVG